MIQPRAAIVVVAVAMIVTIAFLAAVAGAIVEANVAAVLSTLRVSKCWSACLFLSDGRRCRYIEILDKMH